MERSTGPFCQSCSIPMDMPDCFGINTDGAQNDDYCCHYFYDGKFTVPDITKEEMIDLVVSIMVDKVKMSEEQAKQISQSFVPTLKRWKK